MHTHTHDTRHARTHALGAHTKRREAHRGAQTGEEATDTRTPAGPSWRTHGSSCRRTRRRRQSLEWVSGLVVRVKTSHARRRRHSLERSARAHDPAQDPEGRGRGGGTAHTGAKAPRMQTRPRDSHKHARARESSTGAHSRTRTRARRLRRPPPSEMGEGTPRRHRRPHTDSRAVRGARRTLAQ